MILYCLTLLLIPFNNHPLLAYNYAGFTPVKIAGGLAFLWATVYFFMGGKGGRIASVSNRWFLLFAGLFFLSLLFHSDSHNPVALQRFGAICVFYATTLILLDTGEKLVLALVALIAAMDVASAYMVREYLTYREVYENFRPGGIFGDPNYFAASAVAVIPVAVFLSTWFKSRTMKAFCLASAAAMALSTALSQSRGGLIGLAAMTLVCIYEFRKHRKPLFALAAVFAVALALSPASPLGRFESEETGVRVSTESRLELLKSGLAMVAAHPFAGVGPGNFLQLSGDYNENVRRNQMAHNSFLEIAAELGLPALMVFLLLCRAAFSDLGKLIRAEVGEAARFRPLLVGVRTGLAGFLATAFFLSAEYEKILWLYLFFSIAATRLATARETAVPARTAAGGAAP